MATQRLTRRGFVKSSLATVAGATLVRTGTESAAFAAEPTERLGNRLRPIRLGGPVFFGVEDPEALAQATRKLGYRAAYCPPVELSDTKRIDAIAKAFAANDVVIAEVGRWCNLLDPDPVKRAANLKTVTDGLALAEAIGARCCVDIAGSYNKDVWYGPHPDNLSQRFFDETVENARKIIDAVKPQRARFCFEMMGWSLPDSPEAYLKLIKAIDRRSFGVHVDICNMVNSPARFYRTTDLINECFDKLGPWIVSCHAKDLTWDVEMNVHFREVPCGQGKVDLKTYLRRLAALDHEAPLMIEHCANEQEYTQARTHLQELGPKAGVEFG